MTPLGLGNTRVCVLTDPPRKDEMTPEERKLPRHCYLCSKQLQFKRGGGYYRAIRIIDGYDRHLHISCAEQHDDNPDLPTHLFPATRVDPDQ